MAHKETISLCMIARNEEYYLKQCLESVKGLPDEIILVDTGSQDRTVEIAESYGAKIYHSPWANDFSSPRNLSLSKATGDWILVLDADEAIDASDHKKLRLLTGDRQRCYSLTQRHYLKQTHISSFRPVRGEYPQWEKDALGYFDSSLVRFFPNHSGLGYRGLVHELLEHSIAERKELTIVRPGILIHHYGQLKAGGPAGDKYHLYTQLGEEKASRENHWKSFYELGVQYQNNQDWQKSIDAFTRALELNPRNVAACINLAHSLGETGQLAEAEKSIVQALQLTPRNNEAWCNRGVIYMRMRDYKKAAQCLLRAVELNSENVNAWLNLGESMFFLGQLKEAAKSFENALRLTPADLRAREGMATCYLVSGKLSDAEKFLAETIRENPDVAKLHYLLAQTYKASKRALSAIQELEKAAELSRGSDEELARVCRADCKQIKAALYSGPL